ncbi:hypothetical protein [Acidovorax sp. LjRoot194]|uniref:hypothetical protein n=1 Tax=Acidovorax sp. LjRoot194 TaxID=3342280 RepID=UPI003ECF8719
MTTGAFPLPAITHAAVAALTAVLTLASAPAHAVGRLADITIVDRDTGATLPVHYAKGEYWVAGRPGARYAVTVHNRSGERLLAVPSVDGVNVLSGETAAWDQRGYVFSPYERYQITGWRKSSSEVAAFEFSSIANSYAGRTGRPANVGVIGVALFREQQPVAVPSITPEPYRQRREARDSAELQRSMPSAGALPPPPASPAAAASAAPAPAAEADSSAAAPSALSERSANSVAKSMPAPSPRLGTAHGQRETSVVSHTTFTRLQDQPNEVISIRYDSRANLVASGVIREQPARAPSPRAFPQSDNVSYVPDPN